MLSFLPIYKREFKTYLQSPSTYVVLALFFLIAGLFFQFLMSNFSMMSSAANQPNPYGMQREAPNVTVFVIHGIFQIMSSMVLFTIPMLSMRLIAEEKSSGTFELLVTCPVSDWAILLGKYFALVSVGVLIVLLSAIFPVAVWWVGKGNGVSPEWPVVLSAWIGLLLIFATYAAFGVMASALTENQIASAVITLIGLLLWNVLTVFRTDQIPWLNDVIQEFTASAHTENCLKGVLMLKDFVFYGLASFLFLFIASKTLDARRWRI